MMRRMIHNFGGINKNRNNMETLESFAIFMIAIMCWLFCTTYCFIGMCDENDKIFEKLITFFVATFIGWIIVPIYLGVVLLYRRR